MRDKWSSSVTVMGVTDDSLDPEPRDALEPFLTSDPDSTTDAPDADADDAERKRLEREKIWSRRYLLIAIAAVFLTITGLLQTFGVHPSGYLTIEPGPAPHVVVKNHAQSVDAGSFYFTTVEVSPLTMRHYLWYKLTNTGPDLVPDANIGATPEARAASSAEMNESKALASVVASRLVDPKTPFNSIGAKVLTVKPDSPASQTDLSPGDIITKVNSTLVTTPNELVAALSASNADVVLSVTRAGSVRSVPVTLTPEKTLGAEVATSTKLVNNLDIDSSGVGGPSGGLMFTLADIDALTPGDFTGGQQIAGTGTINSDGTIGPIGGVEHKVIGARNVGATVFFSPRADAAAARDAAPRGLKVVTVDTVSDAVTYLCQHGGASTLCTSA